MSNLKSVNDINYIINGVQERFKIAQGSSPTEVQLSTQRNIMEAFIKLAILVELEVPEGREQSLTLTKLEEALMWAGKGIFKS